MVMVSTISAFDSLQGWRVLALPNLIAIQSTSRLSFRKSQALRVKCDYSCFELLAGLSKPTSGSICIQKYSSDGNPIWTPEILPSERVGIVFQFPERYFVADNMLDEVKFGWPRQKGDYQLKEHLALRFQRAINWVGLNGMSLDKDPYSLSGGYNRRIALAIQLVQTLDLLILDEPLADLDWKAVVDGVKLLKHLKKELTILVRAVSTS